MSDSPPLKLFIIYARRAHMYENGEGVAQNTSAAIFWYRKAADQGYQGAEGDLNRLGYSE